MSSMTLVRSTKPSDSEAPMSSYHVKAVDTIWGALRRTERVKPDPEQCVWCGDSLELLSEADANDPVVQEFGRLCKRCKDVQDGVRG